jgi:glyoxylate reductase
MVKPRIVVTRRWPEAVEGVLAERFDAVLNRSDEAMSAEDLQNALRSADAVLATVTDRFDARVFDVGQLRTRIIGNFGTGYTHIDLASARKLGIAVTSTPDVLSECTADLTVMLMLMAARRAVEGERELRTGAWTGWSPTHLLGTKLAGKMLGIVGFGRVGQEVARRAALGFGMRVLACSRSPIAPGLLKQSGAVECHSLEALLGQSDFVSLHCPGGAANRHLIDARRLNQMKPTAILVNTSHGDLVDMHALIQAQWFETIGGVALDVYEDEPAIPAELLACERTVLLPHMGSATRETREAMGLRVARNLEDFFSGRQPCDLVS